MRRYVMLAQDEMSGTMFERVGDDWVGHLLAADAILKMPEVGLEVPLAELSEGIDLTPAKTAEQAQA